ncbi:MAG: hypothetical protein IPK65_13920 [Gammaproteobacteria bacterium]|jgi:hypothetical protein|nr:hypothetical protein [Gammaproteobacteria bacterium]
MRAIGATAVIACVLVLAACGPSESDMKARGMTERYYQLIQQGQFAEAARFHPEKDRALAEDTLRQHLEKLGVLQSFQISAEEQNTVYSGKFYIYTVDTSYERGHASELLTLKTWVSANDSLSIVSHQIDAD